MEMPVDFNGVATIILMMVVLPFLIYVIFRVASLAIARTITETKSKQEPSTRKERRAKQTRS